MVEETLNVQEIIDYFDHGQVDYEQFWQLNARLWMHCGYWEASTNHLGSALINMNVQVAAFGEVKPGAMLLHNLGAQQRAFRSVISRSSNVGRTPVIVAFH